MVKEFDVNERPDPQTLDEVIRWSKKLYRGIFVDRTDVLINLYLVPNNDYYWANGILKREKQWLTIAEREAFLAKAPGLLKVLNQSEKLVKQHRKLCVDLGLGLSGRYEAPALSESSKLMSIPDDVQWDFLGGAYRMIDWLGKLESTKNNNKNKKLALKIKEDLDKRFPKGGKSFKSVIQK